MPASRVIRVLLDDHAAHKDAKVRASLDRHPPVAFRVTRASSSGLTVEGFVAALTQPRREHGLFSPATDLHAAINGHVAEHRGIENPLARRTNADPTIAARARWFLAIVSNLQEEAAQSRGPGLSPVPAVPSLNVTLS